MIVKFINRNQLGSEMFLEHNGQIGVDSTQNGEFIFNEQYGNFLDKVVILRHYYGYNQHFVIGIDSSMFMVYLLNNQGQNIQRLV